MPRSPSERRRPVYRVFVRFGGRPTPREFNVEAVSVETAASNGLALAREARLAHPHEVESVLHLCDLDQPPRRLRRNA